MFCDHVYKVIGSEICPKCNKITNEVQWKLQHKLEKDWLKKNQSLSYTFKEDLKKLHEDFNTNLICKNNQHPILFKKFLGKEICLETLCLLLEFSGAMKHWNSKMGYDLVWETFKIKIEKYTPFINCDKDKLKQICLDHFTK